MQQAKTGRGEPIDKFTKKEETTNLFSASMAESLQNFTETNKLTTIYD